MKIRHGPHRHVDVDFTATLEPMSGQRVLVVDDDSFARSLLVDLLTGHGYQVDNADSGSEALSKLEEFDPHILLLDLDLGEGPTGLDVFRSLREDMPWVAVVFLTSHRSPVLVDSGHNEPADAPYLVKADIRSADQIDAAIQAALAGQTFTLEADGQAASLTIAQADVLRMMADGLSNQQIADARGTGLRAAEAMVARTLEALGFFDADPTYARAQAIRMYLSSQVKIRER